MRNGTETPASASTTVPSKKFVSQIPANQFDVHKVTITATVTVILLKLPTSGLTEISRIVLAEHAMLLQLALPL